MTASIVILAFGMVLIGIFILLVFIIPSPTEFQYIVLRVILALSCATIASGLTGFLEIQMPVPFYIKAGGAFAMFIVVYFAAPAALRAPLKSSSSAPKVGDRVRIFTGGQRDVAVATKGLIGWTQQMARYRGQVGQITQIEKVFEAELVYRLSLDGGQHQWHSNWFEVIN